MEHFQITPEGSVTLSPALQKLAEFVTSYNPQQIAQSLNEVFELALFSSDVSIGQSEKGYLLDVKILKEVLQSL
jgi:hypothetical protein